MIDDRWNELAEGEIHFRDKLQFELKNEFYVNPLLKETAYKQEVYLFIPQTLQINSYTYSKKQFYLDQTNLIRYKTPQISLEDLVDPDYPSSPLNRLQNLLDQESPDNFLIVASDELKLLGAIIQAAISERVFQLNTALCKEESKTNQEFDQNVSQLCKEIEAVTSKLRQLMDLARQRTKQHQLIRHFRYIDEYTSIVIEEFLLLLAKKNRDSDPTNSIVDKELCQFIAKEKVYRKKMHFGPKTSRGHLYTNESILYRQSLLNRFVLEALTLNSTRFSIEEKHIHILGAFAAGIAMLVYMLLLVRGSSAFLINSFPFVFLAVVLYIVKDRIKEGFKRLYYRQAHRWFPDYSTKIQSPKGFRVGKLKESFSFIDAKQLPVGFLKIRNYQFHEELQALHRHESILQYKREVILNPPKGIDLGRRREMTSIFRLNIHRFLEKAGNSMKAKLSLDSDTEEITMKLLPKIYHLNLIIRNTYYGSENDPEVEIKAFRVVIDKEGIKRVEHIQIS